MNLDLSMTNGMVSSKTRQDGFKLVIVNFPFLDGDVPRPHFSQLIRFQIKVTSTTETNCDS